jgi:DNA-binding NarL/FixJ family response regulator
VADTLRPANLSEQPPASFAGSGLTPRERQVADILCGTDWPARKIAESLSLSCKTIAVYTTQIYSKLGVHSRVGLIRLKTAHVEPTEATTHAGGKS